MKELMNNFPKVKDVLRNFIYKLKHIAYKIRLQDYRQNIKTERFSHRVLIVMNAAFGNAIEVTPLVQATRALWPKAHITLFPPDGGLFDDWNIVNDTIHNLDDLSDKTFDYTFLCSGNIPQEAKVMSLGKVLRVPILLGAWFLKAEREYHLDILRNLGYSGKTPPLYFPIRKPEIEIQDHACRIAIMPCGKITPPWHFRRWPYYSELIEKILNELPDSQICIIGTNEDTFPGNLVQSERIVDLRGKLSLRETGYVLHKSALAIGHDCGPVHIADAVQTPTIVLMGPSCELKKNPIHGIQIVSNVICRPCMYSEQMKICTDPICIKNITVDEVFDKVKLMIKP